MRRALDERLADADAHALDVATAVSDGDAVALELDVPTALALDAPDRVPDPPDADALPVALACVVVVRDARADADELGVEHDVVVAEGAPESDGVPDADRGVGRSIDRDGVGVGTPVIE